MKPFEVVLLFNEAILSAMYHALAFNLIGFLVGVELNTGFLMVLGIMDYGVFYVATHRREHIRKIIEGEEN